ncbi:tRNA epoxyqueuosine(34) reductase QueG [Chlorobium sp. KB01]|uniref:tRNA epoxyqueuosine(34) reductase QueG n=1 Tax=Chlorobium sp. KB01 TaxID=1917528 RepID=UPI00097733EC|nr:tRNA epoxyqueuosine(34) reductase QueG [Chlorobium sp. KB01]
MSDAETNLCRELRKEAARLGFSAIGFSTPHPQQLAVERFAAMIREKRHGEMHYMEQGIDNRAEPAMLLPGLKTVISAAISYNNHVEYREGQPKISRYALIADYHTVVRSKLEQLLEKLKALTTEPVNALITVDSSPVLEKTWAEDAGIGKPGKNTLLIVPSAGSQVFLGEIFIDFAISESRAPLQNLCGSCNLCIEHCPTGALTGPGKIDASRCISYLTGELKRDFSEEEQRMVGEWLFGCDLCMDVCPHNRQSSIKANDAFALRQDLTDITTKQIMNLTKSGFRKLFLGTPVFRIGLRRLKRNAKAVAENIKQKRR